MTCVVRPVGVANVGEVKGHGDPHDHCRRRPGVNRVPGETPTSSGGRRSNSRRTGTERTVDVQGNDIHPKKRRREREVHKRRLAETEPRRHVASSLNQQKQQLTNKQRGHQTDDAAARSVTQDRERHVDGELERERQQGNGTADERQVDTDGVDSERVVEDPLGEVALEGRADVGVGVVDVQPVLVVGGVVSVDVDGSIRQQPVLRLSQLDPRAVHIITRGRRRGGRRSTKSATVMMNVRGDDRPLQSALAVVSE